eukprot:3677813-Rhodomonas_salina.1
MAEGDGGREEETDEWSMSGPSACTSSERASERGSETRESEKTSKDARREEAQAPDLQQPRHIQVTRPPTVADQIRCKLRPLSPTAALQPVLAEQIHLGVPWRVGEGHVRRGFQRAVGAALCRARNVGVQSVVGKDLWPAHSTLRSSCRRSERAPLASARMLIVSSDAAGRRFRKRGFGKRGFGKR